MSGSTIIDNPVNIRIDISKAGDGWNVTPSLTAFPKPDKPTRKDIRFVLDRSGSMAGQPLEKVKKAVKKLLDKLTPSDRFSVIPFDNDAEILIKRQRATQTAVDQAKTKIDGMNNQGGTSFINAFKAVSTSRITGNSTIIFLTDGDDTNCSVDDLLKPFHVKNIFPRVIPIGVNLKKGSAIRKFLNDLYKESGGIDETAIFVEAEDNTDRAYEQAFEKAFQMVSEYSEAPVQLDMTIEAEEEKEERKKERKATSASRRTVGHIEERKGVAISETDEVLYGSKTSDSRKLNTVCYDGETPVSTTQYFAYSIPPSKVKLRFRCDDTSVETEYMLTPDEKRKIKAGQSIPIDITAFKWKNYSNYSWAITLGCTFLGLLLLGSVAMSVFVSPNLNLWAWKVLIENALMCLAGLYLFFKGFYELVRKTIFLPRKLAAADEFKAARAAGEEKKAASRGLFSCLTSFEELKEDWVDWIDRLPPYVTIRNILMGSALTASGAVGGATAGYFGSTTSAASVLIPAYVSASLFVKICAVAGGVALPLLAYGCWKFYSFASNHPNCPTRKTLAYGTMFATGGVAGYLGSVAYWGGKASLASASFHGLNPFLLKVACSTVVGAAALPLLAYTCWRLYSFASTHSNAPSKKTLTYGTLFAAGGAAGYWGSATSAATAFIPSGVSPFVFSMGCTVLGAAALVLFAYGCARLYDTCTVVQPAYRRR